MKLIVFPNDKVRHFTSQKGNPMTSFRVFMDDDRQPLPMPVELMATGERSAPDAGEYDLPLFDYFKLERDRAEFDAFQLASDLLDGKLDKLNAKVEPKVAAKS